MDDYIDREAGAVAAATAAAVSPRARELLRRGTVYGLAGVLRAGDVVVAAARGAVRGAKDATAAPPRPATGGSSRARQSRSPDDSGATSRSQSGRTTRSGSSRSSQAGSRRRSTPRASRS